MDFLKVISGNNKITTGFEALNSLAGTFRCSVTARFETACLTKSNSILSNKSSGYVFKTYGRPILSAVHAIFGTNTFRALMFTHSACNYKGYDS